MLVTNCPQCGKPTPARLASPDELVCAACGYDGPPLPAAVPTLQAAREFLLSRNVADRQLTDARARALSQNASTIYGIVFVLALLPWVWSMSMTLFWSYDLCGGIERFGSSVLGLLPFVGLSYYGALSLRRIQRAQAELRAACAASPPARAGEPARCHVCGGPLPAGGAVVRCPFCATDNYADLSIIADLGDRQTHDIAEYEFAVARVESFAKSVTSDALKTTIVRSLAVWFLAGYPAFIAVQLISRIHLPPSSSGRYAFEPSNDGDCYARAKFEPGEPLSALVGTKVRVRNEVGLASGTVTQVYATLLGSFAVVSDQEGGSEDFNPFDLCTDPAMSVSPASR